MFPTICIKHNQVNLSQADEQELMDMLRIQNKFYQSRLVQKLEDNGKKLEIFQTKILEQLMTIKTREHDYNIILDMISQDNTTMDKWKSIEYESANDQTKDDEIVNNNVPIIRRRAKALFRKFDMKSNNGNTKKKFRPYASTTYLCDQANVDNNIMKKLREICLDEKANSNKYRIQDSKLSRKCSQK